jgi:flagellar biosynthesis/type III secretory pathway protein FliH
MGHVIKNWAAAAPAVVPPPDPPPATVPAAPPVTEAEVEAARAAARRDGFAAGYADAVARAAGLLADAEAEADRALETAGDAALALAGKMAEKILGRAVALEPSMMAEIAAQALAACRPGEPAVRIRVHPDDLPAVEARRDWLAARAPSVRIDLAADEAVGRYGCVIDTARGRIDGRLSAQLAALVRAVRGDDQPGRPAEADGG